MSFQTDVIRSASRRLEQLRTEHAADCADRKSEIYAKIPRIREIDSKLRATVPTLLAATLRKGGDPQAAIAALRRENLALQQERAALLTDHDYPADALDEKPMCPLCKDSGWQGARMCSCLKALCAEEQIRALSSMLDLNGQSFDAFRLDYYPDDPALGVRGISPRTIMRATFDFCRSYAEQFPNHPTRNLFLTGAPGLGKTFLSASIARVVSQQGYSVVYDTAGNIFKQFEADKFGRGDDAGDCVHRYLNCDLLIVDDLGSELTTSFTQSALYDIINTRLISSDLRTVFSSNLSVAELQKRYQPQIVSRLTGEYRLFTFYGTDIRNLRRLP